MNRDERIVEAYLTSLGLGAVLYEPDGRVPPDFLVGGRIAVEVRRLNQHQELAGRPRGLEEDTIPLFQGFRRLLSEFRLPGRHGTWFVWFRFQRPLLPWQELRPQVRRALEHFLRSPVDHKFTIPVFCSVFDHNVPSVSG